MLKKWQLKDVILLAFLSIFFGGVFVGSGYVYNILSLLLTPLGSCHCQTLSSVCNWRKSIDGSGTTSDSVPNFL